MHINIILLIHDLNLEKIKHADWHATGLLILHKNNIDDLPRHSHAQWLRTISFSNVYNDRFVEVWYRMLHPYFFALESIDSHQSTSTHSRFFIKLTSGRLAFTVDAINASMVDIFRESVVANEQINFKVMRESNSYTMANLTFSSENEQKFICFFDTETTGIIPYVDKTIAIRKQPVHPMIYEKYSDARVIQFAYILVDASTNEIVKKRSYFLHPTRNDIIWRAESFPIHKLSCEFLNQQGTTWQAIWSEFQSDMQFVTKLVAYNIDFDDHILQAEWNRMRIHKSWMEFWIRIPRLCMMKVMTERLKISPSPSSRSTSKITSTTASSAASTISTFIPTVHFNQSQAATARVQSPSTFFQFPSLTVAYESCFGKKPEKQHCALMDSVLCFEIYCHVF